jgi:hypothetical protein
VPADEDAGPVWRRFADCSRDELERAIPYAVSHGKPPVKAKPPEPKPPEPPPEKPPPPPPPPLKPKPPEPPPNKPPPPPPPPTASPVLTPGRVVAALAVVAVIAFVVRMNQAPTQAPPPDWKPPVVESPAPTTVPAPPPFVPLAPVRRVHPTERAERSAAEAIPDAGAAVAPDPLGGKEKDLTEEQLQRILEKERREEHPPIIQ